MLAKLQCEAGLLVRKQHLLEAEGVYVCKARSSGRKCGDISGVYVRHD